MPLQFIRQDITRVSCDAIVNAANQTLLGGGGVDGAIHRAAGPELLQECRGLGGCQVGQAKLTGGYRLPSKYVIHTVGPIWRGGGQGEREKLAACYRNSLELGKAHGCESIAFPLISAGVYGYPKEQALQVAIDTITAFLSDHDMLVYLVIFGKQDFQISSRLIDHIRSYIDDNYADAHTNADYEQMRKIHFSAGDVPPPAMGSSLSAQTSAAPAKTDKPKRRFWNRVSAPVVPELSPTLAPSSPADGARKYILEQLDESFSQMLLRKIDEKGITDAQCYKKANIDRKLFSKIRSDPGYRPSKPTALAFAIALELPLDEARDLLMKAGFALSHSSIFDLIVEYFIRNKNYNIFEINEALFSFDQSLLGG